jgi:hypothetical protein
VPLCIVSLFICCYAECNYAKSRYAKCRYAKCRGALLPTLSLLSYIYGCAEGLTLLRAALRPTFKGLTRMKTFARVKHASLLQQRVNYGPEKFYKDGLLRKQINRYCSGCLSDKHIFFVPVALGK